MLLICVGSANAADRNFCLECHPVHYGQDGDCVSCHRGFAGTPRLNIAHQGLIAAHFSGFTRPGNKVTESGHQLIKRYACRRCHVTGDRGNRLAANLDYSQVQKTPEALDESIRQPVLFMPQFHFYDQQRIALINALLDSGRQLKLPAQEQPLVVHFEGESSRRELVFEKQCGKCHRVLTSRFGGVGESLSGPNLSGLLSEFYPPSFSPDKLAWTVGNLQKWIKNPRSVRKFARMPPVDLNKQNFDRLVSELMLEPSALQE